MLRLTATLCVLLLCSARAASAFAGGDFDGRALAGGTGGELDQAVYKGVLGSVLDGVPMDAATRVGLQRTNAVLGNTLTGRSLAALAGMSNPLLLVGGFVWGVWAASNIKQGEETAEAIYAPGRFGAGIAPEAETVARLAGSKLAAALPSRREGEPVLAAPASAAAEDAPLHLRAPVLKVWLPQRSANLDAAR
jgi:hypothetical protein